MPTRILRTVGWIVAAATALTGVSSAIALKLTIGAGQPPAMWYRTTAVNAAYWYLWAAFAPAILWLSRRFPLERRIWMRAVPVHLAAVTVFSIAHVVGVVAVQYLLRRAPWTMSLAESVSDAIVRNLDWEMVTYLAVVGASQAARYYQESQERRVAAAALEAQLAEARLQNLRQQLHPHFLFNTLHAISTLMHRDVEAADRMLTRLSDLLRLSLERLDTAEVTLKDELDFLGKYVEIQCARFEDRLGVRVDVDVDTLHALVPTLILQPLVENAIRHGIAPRAGPGHIEVVARREGDVLRIEVRDDGIGCADRQTAPEPHGIGLSTTRARLRGQYGDACRFEVQCPPAGGFVVRIGIPWRTDAPLAPEIVSVTAARRAGLARPVSAQGAGK